MRKSTSSFSQPVVCKSTPSYRQDCDLHEVAGRCLNLNLKQEGDDRLDFWTSLGWFTCWCSASLLMLKSTHSFHSFSSFYHTYTVFIHLFFGRVTWKAVTIQLTQSIFIMLCIYSTMWDNQVINCLILIFKVSWVFPHKLLVLLLGLIINHIAQEESCGKQKNQSSVSWIT